jgi:hypothetical protein
MKLFPSGKSHKHFSQKDIAQRFGIPTSALGDMLKNATKIRQSFENSTYSAGAKRHRKPRLDDVDVALLAWFKKTRMNNPEVAISGRVLLEKANDFAKELAHGKNSISAAWIDRWNTRHNIMSKKMRGEWAALRESDVLHEWKDIKLRQILGTLAPRDIYNKDETGLFWKALPDRALAFKNERVSGGKLSKERVTCLYCASMAGEKVSLLVIGKYANERAFKRANRLPVEYRANRKAWMTSTLFLSGC